MKRILALLTVCALLLPCFASADVVTLPLDFSGGMKPQAKYPSREDVYDDPSIHAEFEKIEFRDEFYITAYIARVRISNGSQIRTLSAGGFDSRSLASVQNMARRVKAVVACNGDYYSGEAGRYVLRQGIVFRDGIAPNQDLLLIDENGDFHIVLASEGPENMDKTTVDGKRVNNAICFGPSLIRDGEIVVDPENAQPSSHPLQGEQRIVICQTGPLEYLVVAVAHWGMELDTFARFLQSLGNVKPEYKILHAYNLDGGNSSHLVFMGTWKNQLQKDEYRDVPDIIYFASAYEE